MEPEVFYLQKRKRDLSMVLQSIEISFIKAINN